VLRAALGFLVGALVTASAGAADRPHLLLLVAEDMSARVGAFGDPVAVTPHLDALAAEGVRYPNTFTTAGVCAPSRAALITGVHQISLGAQHMRSSSRPSGGYRAVPPPEVKAFPELLRAAGYYTFVTTKLDYQFSGVFTGSGPFTIWDAEDDDALWAGAPDGQPWFGMLNYNETHESGLFLPLGHPPHGFVHFLLQVARAWQFGIPETEGPVAAADVPLPPYFPDTAVVRADVARHYQNIQQMDAAVGEVLARLEADGLADSTIVVWTTDHGDGLPRAKRELYDSGLRVPMIVRWPEAYRPVGAEPGGVDERLVSFVDLAPTFLELAGAPIPEFVQGRSFVAGGLAPRGYVHASRDRIDEVEDRQRAVRDARWKYIRSWHPEQPGGHRLAFRDNIEMMRELWDLREAGELTADQGRWFEPVGEERLFDTEADPHELRDLAGDPGHAEVLERMRSALDAWLARTPDWSETPEAEMVARFEAEGSGRGIAAPAITAREGRMTLASETPGASIGYRLADGPWRLYTGPFAAPAGSTVRAKAVRYGWDESDEVSARIGR
jgi:N-sulfoglucosamine sulfohydrolase